MSTWYLVVELDDGEDRYCEGCPNLNDVDHICDETYVPLTVVSGEDGDVHLRPDDDTCLLTKMDDSEYDDDDDEAGEEPTEPAEEPIV